MSNKRVQEIIGTILEKRGINKSEQERFLHPDFEKDLHDPKTMLGMDKAVTRLAEAVKNQERVVIFGDYDADGIPATALLTRCFLTLGLTITPLIPTRTDGYGLTMAMVEQITTLKPTVLITVDNGTVAKQEVAALSAAGIAVIVVDHHEPQEGEIADSALAILNPKQKECPYPFKDLCGCALAWKLMNQLYFALNMPRESLKWELDLVALSTIADMVPLLGENRVLAVYGLKVLRKTRNIGLQSLALAAGVVLEDATSTDIGFRLAPRINAPSRMHQELVEGNNAALRLLVTANSKEALQLATYLNQQNSERQQLVDRHVREADQQAAENADMLCIVVYHESWSSGVIGLVASRLLDRYRRPVIALAREGEVIKGSVRTTDAVHALELITAADAVLERYGGHAKAAGLTLSGTVEELRGAVNVWLESQGNVREQMNRIAKSPDYVLHLEDITLELCTALTELEPFGVDFPAPRFATVCRLKNIRMVGKEQQHLSCFLSDGKLEKKGIGFGKAHLSPRENKEYEVQYFVGSETWREVTSPVCYLQDVIEKPN